MLAHLMSSRSKDASGLAIHPLRDYCHQRLRNACPHVHIMLSQVSSNQPAQVTGVISQQIRYDLSFKYIRKRDQSLAYVQEHI